MDLIVFGTGEVAEKVMPYLILEHNVLYCVDNDESKWGSLFFGYEVKKSESIRNYDGNIVVLSNKYSLEIITQLRELNIKKEQIYLPLIINNKDNIGCSIYPLDEKKILLDNRKLIDFDLLNNEECTTSKTKVLIYAAFYSVYTKQLVENISNKYNDIEISIITDAKESSELIHSKLIKHIYCFSDMKELKMILEKIPLYDVSQLLWIEQAWAYFYKLIRKKTKKLNLCVGGSDFYRISNLDRDYRYRLINCADNISAETKETASEFENYYKLKKGLQIIPFGVEVLNYICDLDEESKNKIKQSLGIPVNKIVVTCGHNANRVHQHIKLINCLELLPDRIKRNIVLVFPMTYPSGFGNYIKTVQEKLVNSGLDYVVLTKFMDFYDMGKYASVSDIMIHVQTTDQLSSTMLEELYAGSIVIAGKWLPYQSLHEKGIFFLDTETVDGTEKVLEDVYDNYEIYKSKCNVNRELIWRDHSWETLVSKWHSMWVSK